MPRVSHLVSVCPTLHDHRDGDKNEVARPISILTSTFSKVETKVSKFYMHADVYISCSLHENDPPL